MNSVTIVDQPRLTQAEAKPRRASRFAALAQLSDARVTQLLFGGVLILLCLWHGTRLVLETNDEGIILDAAQRMLGGQRLYVDFFGYMSPGSYWIQELMFRIFGVTMFAGRLPVLIDVALEGALVFWLARSLMNRAASLTCAGFFLWLEIWNLPMLTAQHRWDSGMFALAAVCCAWKAHTANPGRWMFASGCLVGAAAVCTPSVALVGLAVLAWAVFEPAVRRSTIAWIAGAALMIDVAAAILWRGGELAGIFEQIFWLKDHYAAENAMAFGAVNGGYFALLGDASGVEFFARCLLVLWVALPAICPIVGVVAGLLWILRRADVPRRSMAVLLTASALALVASTFPRMDVAHLAWIMAVPFVLAFAGVTTVRNRHIQAAILALFCLCAVLMVPRWISGLSDRNVSTPVGTVHVSAADAPAVSALLSHVHPGDSLYVHPWMPLLYFLTQAHNPTRFSFLDPGMMTNAEAGDIFEALTARPPKWVLYVKVEPEQYLRMFPSADPRHVRFPRIENWIAKNYQPTGLNAAGYQLLRRAESEGQR